MKAKLEDSFVPNRELIIAFKNYTFSDLKKESLEEFVTDSLNEDWIPFKNEAVKLYKKING